MINKTVISSDTVQIIGRKMYNTDVMQGYVVLNNDKKQTESAMAWAGKDPDVKLFNNEGFELELEDAANNSSQSGKLSFWNCKITKDGQSFLIGINSQLLLELMQNTTFVKGKCQSKLSFIRVSSQLGMFTKDMPIAKELAESERQKHALKASNAKKFEVGHIYESLQARQVYLGEIYSWVNIEKDGWRVKTLEILRKPIKMHIFIAESSIKGFEAVSVADLFYKASETLKKKDDTNRWYAQTILDRGNLIKSNPRRVDKGVLLENTDYTEQFKVYLESLITSVKAQEDRHRESVKDRRYSSGSLVFLERAVEMAIPMIAYRLSNTDTNAEQVYRKFREIMSVDSRDLVIRMEEENK